MLNHPYVMEKLTEFDRERIKRIQHYQLPPPPRRHYSFLRAVGRALQAAGQCLESWAAPGEEAMSRRDYSRPQPRHY